jgi:hypothetical protein
MRNYTIGAGSYTCDAMPPPARCLDWRPLRKGSLLGFATVQFGSGQVVHDIPVHQAGSRSWANPPGKPWVGSDDRVVRDEKGKVKYAPVISFSNHGVQRHWSDQVLRALREAYTNAIPVLAEAAL